MNALDTRYSPWVGQTQQSVGPGSAGLGGVLGGAFGGGMMGASIGDSLGSVPGAKLSEGLSKLETNSIPVPGSMGAAPNMGVAAAPQHMANQMSLPGGRQMRPSFYGVGGMGAQAGAPRMPGRSAYSLY